MTVQTIKKLNALNQTFYERVHHQFDQTRQHEWPGWIKLLPHLTQLAAHSRPLTVLDVGCGNGRFGQFLATQLNPQLINYLGVDNNSQLLQVAATQLEPLGLKYSLLNFDLVNSLLADDLKAHLPDQQFALIMLSGVLHHIPSLRLRQQLISNLCQLLAPAGLLIVTCWQFARFKRFQAKMIDCVKIGLELSDLEKKDYLLDWQADQHLIRYCHYTDDQEMKKLTEAIPAELIDCFAADGKNNQTNKYYLFQR